MQNTNSGRALAVLMHIQPDPKFSRYKPGTQDPAISIAYDRETNTTSIHVGDSDVLAVKAMRQALERHDFTTLTFSHQPNMIYLAGQMIDDLAMLSYDPRNPRLFRMKCDAHSAWTREHGQPMPGSPLLPVF